MRFKSIILQGFKSFVDKTVVDFPDGITCVVGPNGSGKSNIMDAIRWVFGEQSPKELRGNDMEDVIFGGSSGRKASGFAEVSLTVSDLPESVTAKWGTLSEVTVTRKFYRTGEREYKINEIYDQFLRQRKWGQEASPLLSRERLKKSFRQPQRSFAFSLKKQQELSASRNAKRKQNAAFTKQGKTLDE